MFVSVKILLFKQDASDEVGLVDVLSEPVENWELPSVL